MVNFFATLQRVMNHTSSFLKNTYKWLTAIFILAFALRTIGLAKLPIRLHQDEIMNGYVGRYILLNGKDLHDAKWPLLYFDNFGDYPAVIPMYLSGAFTFIFGLNEFAVRFPIALFGSLAVIPVFFITRIISKDDKTSLFAAFCIAILPWHLVLSRATAEAVPGSTLYLFGLLSLLVAITQKKLKFLLVALLFFFSTYAFYHLFRVVVPLTLLPAFLLTKDRRIRLGSVLLAVFFFLLTATIASTFWGTGRFKQTSIFSFNNQSNGRALNAAFAAGRNKVIFVRVFNNKVVIYAREFLRQYLYYFSPQYLLTDGGRPKRYLIPDHGLVYYGFALIPLIYLLSLYFDPSKNKKTGKLDRPLVTYILFLVFLAPLAAALTLDEAPNVHRSALLGVTLVFPVALAFHNIYRLKLGKIPIMFFVFAILGLEGAYFLNQYIVQSPQAQTVERYDERTDLAKWIIANHDNYDAVYVTREMFIIYYLFYSNNFDPALAGKFSNSLFTPQVGNVHFIDDNCPTLQKDVPRTGKIAVIDKAECIDKQEFDTLNRIMRLNSTDAYKIHIPWKTVKKN